MDGTPGTVSPRGAVLISDIGIDTHQQHRNCVWDQDGHLSIPQNLLY